MKNAFTLIELLAVILILGILSSIAVVSYSSYMESVENSYYVDAEKSMKGAAESLITYCNTSVFASPNYCVNVPGSNSSVTIDLSTLTENNFLKKIVDQKKDSVCSGSVVVTNKAPVGSINHQLDYKVCLSCASYKSSGC